MLDTLNIRSAMENRTLLKWDIATPEQCSPVLYEQFQESP
jgi:hypothetical protein